MRAQESPDVARDFLGAATGARKKRPPKRNLTIRLSDDERAVLVQEAGKLSLAAYVRRKLLGASVTPRRGKRPSRKPRVPDADQMALARVLALLGRSELAASLDSIAKAAVMGALPVTPELVQELHAACRHVRAIRDALMEALGVKRGFENDTGG